MIDGAIASTASGRFAQVGATRAPAITPGQDPSIGAGTAAGNGKPAAPFQNRPMIQGATLLAAQTNQDAGKAQTATKTVPEDGQGSEDPGELTPEEQDQVEKLKDRDAEVRRHEEAHARVGGPYAGSPTYNFQTGPDGKKYAIGGSVSIDASPVDGDPKATIAKMEIVKRAALAPAEPSSQDRKVAAEADQAKLQAQAELMEQNSAKQTGGGVKTGKPADPLAQVTSADAPGGTLDLVA